ncbi:MAG: tRNA (N(6)-L-threonylcarbamoyladenosine(37)-C(2))-methylthiotransferase MtaB [Nitrospirae bacterium]|nr:tRNA (N(6)-L-threonylcarbamoyladenosine(37)-C(2))-methylthiotransferase MtaB [Nitrospirota bacterium]
MKISILTLGCKVNQAESSMIGGALEGSGHEIVDLSDIPDICVINTCTVTAKSDYQSRQLIRRAHRVGARVIVTGCYSESQQGAVKAMEGVEQVIRNANKLSIITKLTGKPSGAALYPPSHSRSRLSIKIQDGCNNSCSYCAIPGVRGVSKSVDPNTVIMQVNQAVSSGYNEIVLTGIHLGSYGYDLIPKVKLSNILKTILNTTKIQRIRLSSIEIGEIDDELLELCTDSRICQHLHIPLQSGDDKTLKLMNRTYDSSKFSLKIKQINRRLPDIAIGTDVIVGFPGEGEAEFKNSYSVIEGLPISYMHSFPFSPRPGTTASKMSDDVAPAIKKERMRMLTSLNKRKKLDYMMKQIGKDVDVLIEECDHNICSGTTGNYLKIQIPSNNNPRGTIVHARVEGIKDGKLIGCPIDPLSH